MGQFVKKKRREETKVWYLIMIFRNFFLSFIALRWVFQKFCIILYLLLNRFFFGSFFILFHFIFFDKNLHNMLINFMLNQPFKFETFKSAFHALFFVTIWKFQGYILTFLSIFVKIDVLQVQDEENSRFVHCVKHRNFI